MTSSRVSSMLLFLLVLLVLPHIDMVLGAQMEHRKLKETNHADQVTVPNGFGDIARRLTNLWNKWQNKPPKFKLKKPPNSCKEYLAFCNTLPRTSTLYKKANCETVQAICTN